MKIRNDLKKFEQLGIQLGVLSQAGLFIEHHGFTFHLGVDCIPPSVNNSDNLSDIYNAMKDVVQSWDAHRTGQNYMVLRYCPEWEDDWVQAIQWLMPEDTTISVFDGYSEEEME